MSYRPEPAFRHDRVPRIGVLLVNLGTPDAPTPAAVRRYLAEFLTDPRVVEIPPVAWRPLLHGVVLRTRPAKSAARYQAIWTKDVAEFHGTFVNFDALWAWPKPVQKPHPPILLGGESGYTLQRVVDFCDGWYPRGRAPEKVLAGMKDLKERAAKAGRDMRTITVSAFATPPDKGVLDQFAAAGVTRSILLLPPEPRDKVLPLLDQYAKLIK